MNQDLANLSHIGLPCQVVKNTIFQFSSIFSIRHSVVYRHLRHTIIEGISGIFCIFKSIYVIITDQVNADVIFFKDISLCLDHGL